MAAGRKGGLATRRALPEPAAFNAPAFVFPPPRSASMFYPPIDLAELARLYFAPPGDEFPWEDDEYDVP